MAEVRFSVFPLLTLVGTLRKVIGFADEGIWFLAGNFGYCHFLFFSFLILGFFALALPLFPDCGISVETPAADFLPVTLGEFLNFSNASATSCWLSGFLLVMKLQSG